MNTRSQKDVSCLQCSFDFSEPTDKPLMKSLLKLRNMKLIQIEWLPGDIRYNCETPFSVKKHLSVIVKDPDVDLYFPTICGVKTPYNATNEYNIHRVKPGDTEVYWPEHWERQSHVWKPDPECPKQISPHSDFSEYYNHTCVNTGSRLGWRNVLWNDACPLCIQTGVWGYIYQPTTESFSPNMLKSPPVCFVGCQECVKNNKVPWTWGHIKINDIHIDLPCNGGHSPVDYPVVIPPDERYHIYRQGILSNTIPSGEHAGGWTGYGCWGQENMNREIIRNSLKELILNPETEEETTHIWRDVFSKVPQRVTDLILRITGLYKVSSPELVEIKPGEPDMICIHAEARYCDNIPNSLEVDAIEQGETALTDIDTLPLSNDYSEGEDEEEDLVDIQKRKESARKGLSLLEEVMNDEGKLDEGKYLELCNVFRDIHQN